MFRTEIAFGSWSSPARPRLTRRGAAGAGLGLAGVLAAACGSSAPSGSEAAPSRLAGTARVTYLSPAASGARLELETALFTDFNRSRPNNDVVVDAAAGPGSWVTLREKFIVSAAGGQPVSMVQNGWGGWLDLVEGGSVAELTPFFKRDRVDTKLFLDEAVKSFTEGGKVYGLPITMSVDALAYNMDLFDRYGLKYPPLNPDDKSWTTEKFLEYARTMSRMPDHIGFGGNLGGGNAGGMSEPTYFGQGVWDDAKKQSLFNTPVARRAMQWWLDLLIKHKVQPTADEITALHGGATTGNVFFSGKVGMQVFYSSTDRLPFRWGLATLPYSGPAGSKNTSGRFFCHGLHMGQVKEKDAVWEVFKWLTRPENGGRFVVTAGHATSPIVNGGSDAAQKTYQERAGVDARAYVLMAQSVRVEGHGVYKYATSGQVLTTIGEFYKQMRDGKMSVDEYADRAAGIMNQQLVPPKR